MLGRFSTLMVDHLEIPCVVDFLFLNFIGYYFYSRFCLFDWWPLGNLCCRLHFLNEFLFCYSVKQSYYPDGWPPGNLLCCRLTFFINVLLLLRLSLHFDSHLKQLYISNKMEHFSCKGRCAWYTSKCLRRSSLGYRLTASGY